jgi:hypothetical protein
MDNKKLIRKQYLKNYNLEYQPIYYEKNKERILKRHKEIYICECGSEIQLNEKSRHIITKKHLNF